MKKALFVVVLALILTFAFAMGAYATTGKFFKGGVDYYRWTSPTGSTGIVGTVWVASGVSGIGSNPANPGAHANYLATTAKCGMCHSVHRAAGDGVKLLPTANATCSGCHVGGTAITAKVITWADVNLDWVPTYTGGVLDEAAAAGGGGGPHNDPVWDTVLPDLIDANGGAPVYTYPDPSYELEPFSRYGCATRRCHSTNPHGANSSKYKIFAAKLLFNNSPAVDAAEEGTTTVGSYGRNGLADSEYDALGATDAAVQRFIDANPLLIRASLATTAGVEINKDGTGWRQPDVAETHALVAGLTCGRPCVGEDEIGNDECHAEASYAIFDKDVRENRNHATGITAAARGVVGRTSAYTTDNVGSEALGWGGNDNRDSKTGHVAGTFAAVNDAGSYAPIAGCTSCHDQTDAANTVSGNFTFPHGQTATGATNLYLPDGTSATGLRVRIWAGYAGSTEDTKTTFSDNYANQKAFDGQCLKCHRDGAGNGIGLTH